MFGEEAKMKFEYKQVIIDLGLTLGQKKQDTANELLNELGKDGWERLISKGLAIRTRLLMFSNDH
jgi:hypothetical protein